MAKDLTGMAFGRLVVTGPAEDKVHPSGQKSKMWACRCSCGNTTVVNAQNLVSGMTKSCGCIKPPRNGKVCPVCGRAFEAPPSGRKTCSRECSSTLRSRTHMGHGVDEATRSKISEKAKDRDMTGLGGTEAAQASPNSGRFVTNVNAIDWVLVSPEGVRYECHNLNEWVRNNYQLFGEPAYSERIVNNSRSGLTNAKRGAMGKPIICTYKGWRVVSPSPPVSPCSE